MVIANHPKVIGLKRPILLKRTPTVLALLFLFGWSVANGYQGVFDHWQELRGIYPQKWVLLGYVISTDGKLEPFVVKKGG